MDAGECGGMWKNDKKNTEGGGIRSVENLQEGAIRECVVCWAGTIRGNAEAVG